MARIFISFHNAVRDDNNPLAMPCFYDSFVEELKENGNQVVVFFSSDYYKFGESFKRAERKIDLTETVKKIQDFDPDCIIAFNHAYLDVSKHFDCPIVVWEADTYAMYADKDVIFENPGRYTFFSATTATHEETKEFFKTENVHYVPFTTAVKSEDKEKSINVSFIGSYFRTRQLANIFMQENPSGDEIEQFKKLLLFVARRPERSLGEIFSKLDIQSEKIKSLTDSTYEYLHYVSTNERLGVLSAVADLGLKIYGSKHFIREPVNDPSIALSYSLESVYSLKHNEDIYNSSKIAININHAYAGSGFSWRVADIMASSGCLVTDPKLDLKISFPEIDFFTFENKYEAREICQKLLSEDNLRADYSKKCNEAIDNGYRMRHTMEKIEGILNVKLINLNTQGSVEKFTAVEFDGVTAKLNKTKEKAARIFRKWKTRFAPEANLGMHKN